MNHLQHFCFDKRMTAIIKGIAILLMLLLHCYRNEAYDVTLSFDHALIPERNSVLKVCVGIFTFMVGYGYAFSRSKDWKYSLSHIKKLLIPFWVVLFVFTVPVCIKEVLSTDALTLLYNLVGIDSHFNWYSWFVAFFIFAMIVMPLVSRFIDRKPLLNTVIAVIVTYLLSVAVHAIPGMLENKPLMSLFNSLLMTPVMLVGYLFAHEHYYERINVGRLAPAWIILISLVVIVITMTLRYYRWGIFAFRLDVFYVPLLIGAIVASFNVINWEPVKVALAKLGDVSVYMWFFHALFFTKVVRWFYQPAITIFKDINLVVLWTIVLTFIASWLIKLIVDSVIIRISQWTHRFYKSVFNS